MKKKTIFDEYVASEITLCNGEHYTQYSWVCGNLKDKNIVINRLQELGCSITDIFTEERDGYYFIRIYN